MSKVFWIIEEGKPVEYIRRGSCNVCGECCCKYNISCKFTSALVEDNEIRNAEKNNVNGDWSEWEGWSTHSQYGIWWWWKLSIGDRKEKPCPSFVDGKCTNWGDEDFRAICRDWPVHPDNLENFPDCGFRFERVVE